MRDAFFFGYGSLVNRKTHDFSDAHKARVQGWRRAWRGTDLRAVAFLTVLPAPGAWIDGLIAAVPDDSWAGLDAREAAYGRVPVSDHVDHPLPDRAEIALYAIPDGQHHAPSHRHPILQSYVDVVMQGYFHEFGAEGLARFVATTDGWEAPVMNDRARPLYPRHQSLTPAERRLFDQMLGDQGAQIIPFRPEFQKDPNHV